MKSSDIDDQHVIDLAQVVGDAERRDAVEEYKRTHGDLR